MCRKFGSVRWCNGKEGLESEYAVGCNVGCDGFVPCVHERRYSSLDVYGGSACNKEVPTTELLVVFPDNRERENRIETKKLLASNAASTAEKDKIMQPLRAVYY